MPLSKAEGKVAPTDPVRWRPLFLRPACPPGKRFWQIRSKLLHLGKNRLIRKEMVMRIVFRALMLVLQLPLWPLAFFGMLCEWMMGDDVSQYRDDPLWVPSYYSVVFFETLLCIFTLPFYSLYSLVKAVLVRS